MRLMLVRMTTTKHTETTTYQVQGHDYEVTCSAPATCTRKAHWDITDGRDYDSLTEAREAAGLYDTPAVRIVRTTRVVTTETTVL